MSPSSLLSQDGRLARGPFALAVIAVYFAIFASQMLLTTPGTGYLRVVPFVLVQAVLIWPWFVLHERRLRDAGRPTGIVRGMAVVLALETVLLVTVSLFTTGLAMPNANSHALIVDLFLLIFLMNLFGGGTLVTMQLSLIGIIALMLLPAAISIIFSIWAATRPSVSVPP